MKHFLLLTLAVMTALAGSTRAALLLEYKFNETGTTAIAGGTLAGSAPTLTLQVNGGTPTDLHSASGTGVSGLPGDRAFNNSASVSMGGNGGRAIHASDFDGIDGLASYTWSGWFNVATQVTNNARFMESRSTGQGWLLFATGASGLMNLQLNGVSAAVSTAGYGLNANQWVFFAVTYDGTLASNNVNFYKGTTSTPVVQIGSTVSLNGGTVINDSAALVIGNSTSTGSPLGFNRAFDGFLDNMRIHGAADNSGVLSLGDLEALRAADVIPEPSTVSLGLAGMLALSALAWRRKARQAAGS